MQLSLDFNNPQALRLFLAQPLVGRMQRVVVVLHRKPTPTNLWASLNCFLLCSSKGPGLFPLTTRRWDLLVSWLLLHRKIRLGFGNSHAGKQGGAGTGLSKVYTHTHTHTCPWGGRKYKISLCVAILYCCAIPLPAFLLR